MEQWGKIICRRKNVLNRTCASVGSERGDSLVVQITEEFGLKHGVEPIDHRIVFKEYPTAVHEYMNRRMDRWVDRMYGDSLDALGSTCIIFPWPPLIFSNLLCARLFETRWRLICPTQSPSSITSEPT